MILLLIILGEDIALGYHNLGKVLSNPDNDLKNLEKAERLSREAYRIRVKVYGNDHKLVGLTSSCLAQILNLLGKSEEETMKLYKQALAIYIRNEGPDGVNTAVCNLQLGQYYRSLAKKQQTVDSIKQYLNLSLSSVKESVRITTKNYGSTNGHTIQNTQLMLDIRRELSHTG
jgi:tetratricopeptide (TPR) repeat protein